MNDINTVTLSGRLTRDIELKSTAGGTILARFSLASNHSKKNSDGSWQDVPGFFDVVVWKGQAEYLSKNGAKGDQVVIQGALRWSSWEKDGQKHSKVEIQAETIILKKKGQKSEGGEPQGDPAAAAHFDGLSEDSIPF